MDEKILSITIEKLDLSPRAYNCLKRAGYDTVKQLCAITKDELYSIRNCGRQPADEIIEKLQLLGFYLRDSKEVVSVEIPPKENEVEMEKKLKFRFAHGTIEVLAFDIEEAKALAKSEAIKRGWYPGLLKSTVSRLDTLIDWRNLTLEEENQLRKLLSKAREGDMYEEE